ncbi:hypothetical protein HKBW3S42_01733, partial [Candidatus Hakubella thermalkaliphila]
MRCLLSLQNYFLSQRIPVAAIRTAAQPLGRGKSALPAYIEKFCFGQLVLPWRLTPLLAAGPGSKELRLAQLFLPWGRFYFGPNLVLVHSSKEYSILSELSCNLLSILYVAGQYFFGKRILDSSLDGPT